MELSAPVRKVTKWLTWLTEAASEGDLVAGLDGAEPYSRAFPLEAPDAVERAAINVHMLGLKVALPIFVLDPGTAPDADHILRSHVAGCRFLDRDGADLYELSRRPDRGVQLGRFSYALWRIEPIDGDGLAELQAELRDTPGSDPSWSASPLELIPVGGVTYEVAGEDVEAVSLKVAKP